MRWRTGRRSSNIEDRRGARMGRSGLKLGGGTLVILLLIGLVVGDPMQLLGMLAGGPGGSSAPAPRTRQPDQRSDEQADFVSVVLADTEDTWRSLFAAIGRRYQPPTLVLFTDYVESACGMTSAASGPFYCPADQKVYIDLGFFRELNRLGAPGDFAQAYVLGHEVGHHVQNQLGIAGKVQQLQSRAGPAQANTLSVLMELQADCYAGVWAHHANRTRNILEPGDVEEGLTAAASIGDDRMMRRAGRYVSPESFTHGTSKQRVDWLRRGLVSGDLNTCNTFAAVSQNR